MKMHKIQQVKAPEVRKGIISIGLIRFGGIIRIPYLYDYNYKKI